MNTNYKEDPINEKGGKKGTVKDLSQQIDYLIAALKGEDFVPLWQKSNLTLEEAAIYSGIGRNKLRMISDDENCKFVLWVGSKRLIKRKQFDEFIAKQYSI